jgi:hypothetical protein
MVDYYSLLLRAVTAPGAGDAEWRRGIYDRARRMLATRLRTLRPPPPVAEIATEEAALQAAIDRIESELSWTEHGGIAPDARTHERFGNIDGEPWSAREQGLVATPSRLSQGAWVEPGRSTECLAAGPSGRHRTQWRDFPRHRRRQLRSGYALRISPPADLLPHAAAGRHGHRR